jgi:hypothetical protein
MGRVVRRAISLAFSANAIVPWEVQVSYFIWWLIWNLFLWIVLSLATAQQSAKLSSCRPVANDARQTARCRAACYCDVTFSLGLNRRTGYLYMYKPSDRGNRATSRQRAARPRAVWRASLATRRKGENNIGCFVAIENATRKVYQISHHNFIFFFFYTFL